MAGVIITLMTSTTTNGEGAFSIAFNHAAEEIRFFKSQQWSMTNYSLAAQAALVASGGALRAATYALMALSIVLGFLSLSLLFSAEAGIYKERARMSRARDQLPELKAIHDGARPHPLARHASVVVLVAVNICATVIASLLLCASR